MWCTLFKVKEVYGGEGKLKVKKKNKVSTFHFFRLQIIWKFIHLPSVYYHLKLVPGFRAYFLIKALCFIMPACITIFKKVLLINYFRV